MKIYLFLVAVMTVASLAGCSKYLDVEPKSSVAEEQMFASETGFEQALVGVYSQLSKQSMYGDRLSLGFVSALAQNYTQSSSTAPYYETRSYNYNSDEVRNILSAVWSSSYNAIAGLNKIIEKTESNRSALSSRGYNLIRGEALALRAYIHFDLFRLFGPEYQSGKGQKAIPYETMVDAFANVPATSEEVCRLVLNDITEAADLLKSVDPVFQEGTDMDTRRIRMNYYGVKGLEARVYMYMGDKPVAAKAAQEVVDGAEFPFVSNTRVSAAAGSKDRLFMSELVFALRSRDILTWTQNYFRFYISSGRGLTRTLANINTLYENSTTDVRKLYLFEQDQGILFPSKFWQTYTPLTGEGLTSSYRTDQLIPLIRISEMYYILAEAANSTQLGVVELNKVRFARAVSKLPEDGSVTPTQLQNEIQKEYHKEFYAEGQYFFYLKRRAITRMPFMNSDIPLSIYKLPVPDVELEYNPTYK